jgi:hypothetical protein
MQPKKIALHSAQSIYPLIVTHGKWYIQQVLMLSNNMMLKCVDCFNIQQLSETLNVIFDHEQAAGRAFSAGGDLKMFYEGRSGAVVRV